MARLKAASKPHQMRARASRFGRLSMRREEGGEKLYG
jgi:hypothetical protein